LHFYASDVTDSIGDFRSSAFFKGFLWNLGHVNTCAYSIPVCPGFDNTASEIGGSTKTSRRNGLRYITQWVAAWNIDSVENYPGYGPDEFLITSWNEWHESTSIEPSTTWGSRYLDLTRKCGKGPPSYYICGVVRDISGKTLEDSLVFLSGDQIAVDTTDSNGYYEFSPLFEGNYAVFRDSLIGIYHIHLTSDTCGMNFLGYTHVEDSLKQNRICDRYTLYQNYPNPFNQSTKIEFTLPYPGFVSFNIYDLLGRKVRTLVSENLSSGYKSVVWDGKNDSGKEVASGIYFYRLKIGDFSEAKKLVLLK
jgi:hypothetical protein